MPFYSAPQPIRPDDLHDKHHKHHRKNLNKALYTAMYVSLLVYGVLSMMEVFMENEEICEREYAKPQQNVDYWLTPCHFDRQIW
jgi:hypothetical protein